MSGMAKGMCSFGYPCITFDMRGVNQSTGSATLSGEAEVADVVAVCNWAVHQLNAKRILVVGSSAGAPIAGSAVPKVEEVKGFVGIGYVFGFLASIVFGKHYDNILSCTKPKLFICGDSDGFTSVNQLKYYFNKAAEPKSQHIIEGVGHFELEGPMYDDVVCQQILKFIETYLLPETAQQ